LPAVSVLRLRLAEASDAPALAGLIQALAAFEGRPAPIEAKAVAAWLEDPSVRLQVLLAEEGGQALGYLALLPSFSLLKGVPVLLVENLFVWEAARGRGLGRALLQEAATLALRQGYRRMELNLQAGHPEAEAFYAAAGFQPAREQVLRLEQAGIEALGKASRR